MTPNLTRFRSALQGPLVRWQETSNPCQGPMGQHGMSDCRPVREAKRVTHRVIDHVKAIVRSVSRRYPKVLLFAHVFAKDLRVLKVLFAVDTL
jgi:hypothetical protein